MAVQQVDLDPIYKAIYDVEEEMKSPHPTPPVGTSVLWYDRADTREGSERAAVVTKVEGPGRVTLTIFPPNSMTIHKQGCLYIKDPIHEQRHNSVSRNSGAWDYLPQTKIPSEHYGIHLERLSRKKESLELQVAQAEEIRDAQNGKVDAKKKQSAKEPRQAEG